MLISVLFLIFSFEFIIVLSHHCPNQRWIEASLDQIHVPGAAILVVNQTDILYEHSFGFQSWTPERPIDLNKSIFLLASISKTFIAVAVMQLVEAKRLDLDTDINEYLLKTDPRIFHPFYPNHSITLRHLLSHSASIDNQGEMSFSLIRPADNALGMSKLEDRCFSYLTSTASNWLPNPPGQVSLYSNTGTALVGLIIERVTGIPYHRYVQEKILAPLNISNREAGFYLSDIADLDSLVEHFAFNQSHLEVWKEKLPGMQDIRIEGDRWIHFPFFSVPDYPAGLLRMSAVSLSKFLRMFMNDGSSLLHRESIIEMKTPVKLSSTEQGQTSSINDSIIFQPAYGLIWNWLTGPDGRRLIGHTGVMPGVTNAMMCNEQTTIGVILLSNGDANINIDLARQTSITFSQIIASLIDCFEN